MKLLEQEFYDYKTQPVTDNEVVDLHKTGMSFYDDFLSSNMKTIEYLRKNKNLEGHVVMMSPDEYYQACSDYGFASKHPSVEKLKSERRIDTNTLKHLEDVLTVYKRRFPMPMLNKAQNGQEGLHRMMVIGDMFGWDYKVPVLVVDWANKQRAYDEAKRKRNEKIQYRLKQSVKEALRYTFTNIEELQEQIQWELDKQFEYDDDIETPVRFEFTSDKNSFKVSLGTASYEFDYDDVEFIDSVEDDLDIDDFDLEENEDFLIRYFGDNWRETHPHLKDIFAIKEELEDTEQEVSPEQEKFFKNSQARDKHGKLLKFYHGTKHDFNEFSWSKVGAGGPLGVGFYFTTSSKTGNKFGTVKSIYLNLKNPKLFVTKRQPRDFLFAISKEYNMPLKDTKNPELSLNKRVTMKLKEEGYDGVLCYFASLDEYWGVAYYANQIKVIDNKTPTLSNNMNENIVI